MHIRDGILSPEVCVITGLVSLAAVGFSLRKLRLDLEDRSVPLTGMMAAVVFAGQMVNFPLFGLPVSGHLLGGVLAATILGPWAGCLAITLVLIVQAVLFNDGGLLSLGANVLNMAVVGAWGGYAIFESLRRWLGKGAAAAIPAAVVAAWASVLASATLFCIEFDVSTGPREFDLRGVLTLMVFYHALIGLGEAVITGSILSFIFARRPDLISAPSATGTVSNIGRFVAAGLVAALAIAAFLAPLKSEYPDGLDKVAEIAGFESLKVEHDGLVLNDYEVPAVANLGWSTAATSLAGLFGTCVVFSLAIALGMAARWKLPDLVPESGHAS